jgi:hypothetical protein
MLEAPVKTQIGERVPRLVMGDDGDHPFSL